ncbi:DUF5348 domain-containing protein [Heliophilum fasciatum]|uniref:DUF5348 domain-containing protein n=1 Tax=Heliophilum fasciatum TaxID=35700 RepID=A0A4R2RSA8_9FIRM|nr:DUF5348 domain-containing protein [Heliophilum fasciatum]MCW2278902.1 hypothetical protein [Heliophilum fasciatum]TCP62035.1 hypothetical protein EDD73_1248 [Heliophilum fasciatum]
MSHTVEMSFDREQDRWVVPIGNWNYGLHCGEYFQLHLGRHSWPCRLELDTQWYVVVHNEVRFNLRTNDKYRVTV